MQSRVKLITTTSIVDGIDIERYHGVVSARVVAATNIFSDIMADFSDVFGGKSVTYQKQLKSIYDEAIVLLSEEAAKLGANLVLGLKVDHNEISGRNKQMFFVTATGTAASASSLSVEQTAPPDDVSLEQYKLAYTRLKVIFNIKNRINGVEDHLPYLIHHQITDVIEYVFQLKYYDHIYFSDEMRKQVMQYFQAIEPTVAASFLYEKLLSPRAADAAEYIVNANLVDYDRISLLLNDERPSIRKRCLVLLKGEKSSFHRDDIGKLETLIGQIEAAFPDKSQANDGEKWTCACGKTNKSPQRYCKSCDNDAFGFTENEVKSGEVAAELKEKIYVLHHIFQEDSH